MAMHYRKTTCMMVVEMMLELGANPLIEDDFGLSAKDYAAERGLASAGWG